MQDLNADFTLKDCLLRAVNLTNISDPDNILIQDTVLNLILVHFFHIQVLIGVKILLFLD